MQSKLQFSTDEKRERVLDLPGFVQCVLVNDFLDFSVQLPLQIESHNDFIEDD